MLRHIHGYRGVHVEVEELVNQGKIFDEMQLFFCLDFLETSLGQPGRRALQVYGLGFKRDEIVRHDTTQSVPCKQSSNFLSGAN